jgi:hypothetical protein
VEDVPQVIALIQKIQTGLKAIPAPPSPTPPGGAPIAPYFSLAASVMPELGALIDLVKTQAAT